MIGQLVQKEALDRQLEAHLKKGKQEVVVETKADQGTAAAQVN